MDSYFSIDGGQTAVDQASDGVGAHLNQGTVGDRHDFKPSTVGTVRVQDAFGTPGTAPDLGVAELTALDGVGYNRTDLSPSPEPAEAATLSLIGLGLGGLLLRARKRRSGQAV